MFVHFFGVFVFKASRYLAFCWYVLFLSSFPAFATSRTSSAALAEAVSADAFVPLWHRDKVASRVSFDVVWYTGMNEEVREARKIISGDLETCRHNE